MGETLDTWPAGATFLFNITVANEGAAGASTIELIWTPGEGSEFELLYVAIYNLDTVARTLTAYIDTGTTDETIGYLFSESTGAGSFTNWPKAAAAGATGFIAVGPLNLVSGPMRLRLQSASVADGQDAKFIGAFRLKGGAIPTRTTVGAGTEVVTVTTERVV